MNGAAGGMLLWLVVAWPLLLAVPAVHTHLPRPRVLALLPAAAWLVLPGEVSQVLPWLVFGSGLAIDGDTRWLLAMSVVVWLAAALVSPAQATGNGRTTSFFLVTLAGQLGVVLANDLVTFFSFSTLMGYGYYGLVAGDGGDVARRAAGVYLVFMVVADLVLFEALLHVAAEADDLRFSALAGADAATSPLYLWLVVAGYALKAALWPAQPWLSAVVRSSSRLTVALVGGVPVAMAWLGLVRWLPLGETAATALGATCMALGGAAVAFAGWGLVAHRRTTPALSWVVVAASGAVAAVVGMGLSDPGAWREYRDMVYPAIAAFGVFAASLALLGRRPSMPTSAFIDRAQRWAAGAGQWAMERGRAARGYWAALRHRIVKPLRIRGTQEAFEEIEALLGRWPLATTLLSLLGLIVAAIAAGT